MSLFSSTQRSVIIMSTLSMVKYYFYKGMMLKEPEVLHNMVSLARLVNSEREKTLT